ADRPERTTFWVGARGADAGRLLAVETLRPLGSSRTPAERDLGDPVRGEAIDPARYEELRRAWGVAEIAPAAPEPTGSRASSAPAEDVPLDALGAALASARRAGRLAAVLGERIVVGTVSQGLRARFEERLARPGVAPEDVTLAGSTG